MRMIILSLQDDKDSAEKDEQSKKTILLYRMLIMEILV